MPEEGDWITVSGRHILVKPGETARGAVSRATGGAADSDGGKKGPTFWSQVKPAERARLEAKWKGEKAKASGAASDLDRAGANGVSKKFATASSKIEDVPFAKLVDKDNRPIDLPKSFAQMFRDKVASAFGAVGDLADSVKAIPGDVSAKAKSAHSFLKSFVGSWHSALSGVKSDFDSLLSRLGKADQALESGTFTYAGRGADARTRALNAYGSGPGDGRRVSAKGAGLDVADVPAWALGADRAQSDPADVDLSKIAVSRRVLKRGRLAGASAALKSGVKAEGDGIEPIVLAGIGDGRYVCVKGSHRVAALKIDGKTGKIPVRVLRQPTAKADGPAMSTTTDGALVPSTTADTAQAPKPKGLTRTQGALLGRTISDLRDAVKRMPDVSDGRLAGMADLAKQARRVERRLARATNAKTVLGSEIQKFEAALGREMKERGMATSAGDAGTVRKDFQNPEQLDWDTLAPTEDDERLGALAADLLAGETPEWAGQRHIWDKAVAVSTEAMDPEDPEFWAYVVAAYQRLGGSINETEFVGPVTPAEDVSALTKAKPTPEQVGLGMNAATQAARGKNPASWVVDEATWEKAKAAADKTYGKDDNAYWPAVVSIYEKMGGAIKTKKSLDGVDYSAMLKASDSDVMDLAFRAGIPVGVAMGILDGTFKPAADFPVGDLEAALKSLGKDASSEAMDLFAATGITLGVIMGILDGTFKPTPEMATAIAAARGAGTLGKAALLPIADRDVPWDGAAADQRVREWASSDGSGDKAKVDFAKYGKAFAVAGESGAFGAWKLPFADVIDGKLTAVPRGVFAARGALMGARGGADVTPDAAAKAKALLQRYADKLAEKSAAKRAGRSDVAFEIQAGSDLAKQDLGMSANDMQQAICRAACAKFGSGCWVRDVYPDEQVAVLSRYSDFGGPGAGKLFQVSYEVDSGAVTLGDDAKEVQPVQGYEPVEKADVEFRAMHKGGGRFEVTGLNSEAKLLAESLAKRDGFAAVEHDADAGAVRFVAPEFAAADIGAELMLKAAGKYADTNADAESDSAAVHAVEFVHEGEELTKAAKKGIVYLKVYGPGEVDTQNEWADEATIEDAAHNWLAKHRTIKIQHDGLPDDTAEPVESWVTKSDWQVGKKLVKKGSWVIGVRLGKRLQAAFAAGKLTGASMGGTKIAA